MSEAVAATVVAALKELGQRYGFQGIGISNTRLDAEHPRYAEWLARHYHGEMAYMERNRDKRDDPAQLVPGTLSVISARMDYLPHASPPLAQLLDHPHKAYVSRYALGRDYHKLLRKRLRQLAEDLQAVVGPFGFRVFTDSAPVLEKALAVKAGLGWIGKHSNLLHREHGSWFFIGEIFTDLALPQDQPLDDHCGECRACIDCCPSGAIVAPYVVDSRRCISYLTIEHHTAIPLEWRAAIGNRIYGCDDCQIFCPWNRFEKISLENDFLPRHRLDDCTLLELFDWSEDQFLNRFEGSPIRRIGYSRWRRNLAVALGNAAPDPHIIQALQTALTAADDLVAEHIQWALDRQTQALDVNK